MAAALAPMLLLLLLLSLCVCVCCGARTPEGARTRTCAHTHKRIVPGCIEVVGRVTHYRGRGVLRLHTL